MIGLETLIVYSNWKVLGHLIEQDLFLCIIGKLLNISDNDGNDKVDHDEGAKHYETDQECHCEYKSQKAFFVWVL